MTRIGHWSDRLRTPADQVARARSTIDSGAIKPVELERLKES